MADITPNYAWTNEHQNVTFTADKLYTLWNRNADGSKPTAFADLWAAGIAQIQSALSDAEQETKSTGNTRQVRAVGAGWSLSEATQTGGYLLGTQSLNLLMSTQPAAFIGNSKYHPANMVLAQCGCSVRSVNEGIDGTGKLALTTTGAADGQTIAGAISAGTHGAAFKYGAMQEMVRGIHLIVSSTQQYWIEPTEQVVTQTFIDSVIPDAQRINDDNIFHSAVNAFGCFGVVHALLLEAEPMYTLNVWQDCYAMQDVQPYFNNPAGITTLINAKNGQHLDPATLWHVSMVINPFVTGPTDTFVVTVIYKTPGYPPPYTPPVNGASQSPDTIALIGTVADALLHNTGSIPFLMSTVINGLIKGQFPQLKGLQNKPGDFFSGGIVRTSTHGLSMEMGINAADTQRALTSLYASAQKAPFTGVLGLRYVKGSNATLAFTKFPNSATIEVQSPYDSAALAYYQQAWSDLEAAGIPFTLHWGQCNDYASGNAPAKVRQRWSDTNVDNWIAARTSLLTTQELRDRFSNDMISACGLNAAPAGGGAAIV